MPFEFTRIAEIPELIIVKPKIFEDSRGYFLEFYKESDFIQNGIKETFIQDNYSRSYQGVIRALHYQIPPKAQGKLVRVIKGKVWDVALDIRRSSNTYLQWYGIELSEENNTMFYIPPGFAHGFAALSSEVDFLYKCTCEYSKDHERGIRWNDPTINIPWPVTNPIVSDRDKELPRLDNAYLFD